MLFQKWSNYLQTSRGRHLSDTIKACELIRLYSPEKFRILNIFWGKERVYSIQTLINTTTGMVIKSPPPLDQI